MNGCISGNKRKFTYEKAIELIFALSAFMMIISVAVICFYIFIEGVPPILKIGISNFLFGTRWAPTFKEPSYGILPMILASLFGMLGAIIVGVPIGIFTAIMLAEMAPKRIYGLLKAAIELLAGIPSVVYGFFGLTVIVPFIRTHFKSPTGTGLLAMIIILSVMVLPTIVNISETALRAVPKEYKEGSLALGASKMETVFKVMVPAAKSGILSSVVLGMGRAIGETMAVIMVCGNIPNMPKSLLDTVSPMTATIAKDMSYAGPFHQSVLFGIGVVLFVFIIFLNLILNFVVRKSLDRK
ncbi:MAG: phosphate ABC transporter permease subunit PstC [Clostridiaceae bacterium]|nr:phosphate ABC transporter permease subunit PstC [Clostridiaceae bacterium]